MNQPPTYLATETFRLSHKVSPSAAARIDRDLAADILNWLGIEDAHVESVLGAVIAKHANRIR